MGSRGSVCRSTVEADNGRLAAANEDHEPRSPLRFGASSMIGAVGTLCWGLSEKYQY